MSMAEAVRAAVKAPAPVPAAPQPAPAPATEPVSEAAAEPEPAPAAAAIAPGPELWSAVLAELDRTKRMLLSSTASEASFLRLDGRQFIVGLPVSLASSKGALERPGTKPALEELLQKFSGQRLELKVEVSEAVAEAPQLEVSAPAVPAPESAPTPPAAAKEKPASPKAAKAAEEEEAAARAAKLEEEFRNDPLIKEALLLFDAKIASVT